MGKDTDPKDASRYIREHYKGKYYTTITDNDVMVTVPFENRPDMLEERSSVTAITRLISVARNFGVPWDRIIHQLEAASLTPTTTTAMLAGVLRQHFCIEDQA